jgi:phage terminase large subunit
MNQIKISLQPKQKQALELSYVTPVLFFGGAKGGGKSYLVRAREMIRRMKYPGTKGLIVRRSYPELLSNHIRMFFKEYPQTREWFNKSEKSIYWPNGSITEFSYLQNVDDVFTYQGREFEDISIDEITQHEEDTFKILRSSLRTSNQQFINNGGMPTMLLTGNPGGRGHQWVKRIFIDRNFNPNEESTDYAFVQAYVSDNLALTDADPEYVKRLKDLPPDMVKAYLEGDWNIFSGQFFSEFRNHIHVCPPFIPSKQLQFVGGMDWGRTAPFAFELNIVEKVKYEGVQFNRVYTVSEVTGIEKTPTEWSVLIKRDLKKFGLDIKEISWIRGDPAMFTKGHDMSMSISDQFARNDIRIQPASNDRVGGWTAMHQWLSMAPDGKPYWLMTSNCERLINTLPSLVYDEKKIEDLDGANIDHWADAERYCLKHIQWIDAGDIGSILHRDDTKKVFTAVMQNGKQVGIDLSKFGIARPTKGVKLSLNKYDN